MARGGRGGGSYRIPRDPGLLQHVINAAYRQRGTPYVWGGSSPGGFDCSGLVYWSYRKAGYSGIGRTTYEQINQGIPVAMAHLRPGDIVFPSAHHEGLYVGHGMVLEAPHTGDQVKLIPLSAFGFMTARRLVGGGGGIKPPRGIAGQDAAGLPVPHPNPQMRMPGFAQLQQQQVAMQQQFLHAQTAQQEQFLQAQKASAAQARQQALSDQVAQRVGAARNAQQGLSSAPQLAGASDPAQSLYQQRKSALDEIHHQALRRAGVL